MKYKVAILYICTGEYTYFWKSFYESAEKLLLLNSEKHYFVFTDLKSLEVGNSNNRVHIIYQENLPWPYPTLYRFKMFNRIKQELIDFDYITFFNSNVVINEMITEEEFLPLENDYLACLHPGRYNCNDYNLLPYEKRRRSKAYIPIRYKEYIYVCGGIQGGKAIPYINMIEKLAHNIDIDEKKGIIAIWHDESHWNRFIFDNDNYKLLSCDYAYPEGWDIPFEKKIILLDKQKYISLNNKTDAVNPYTKYDILMIYINSYIHQLFNKIIKFFNK